MRPRVSQSARSSQVGGRRSPVGQSSHHPRRVWHPRRVRCRMSMFVSTVHFNGRSDGEYTLPFVLRGPPAKATDKSPARCLGGKQSIWPLARSLLRRSAPLRISASAHRHDETAPSSRPPPRRRRRGWLVAADSLRDRGPVTSPSLTWRRGGSGGGGTDPSMASSWFEICAWARVTPSRATSAALNRAPRTPLRSRASPPPLEGRDRCVLYMLLLATGHHYVRHRGRVQAAARG